MLPPFIKSLLLLLLTVNTDKNHLRQNDDMDFKNLHYIPSDIEHSYFISYINNTKIEELNEFYK